MHADFIKLKPLEGELKLSHKKNHFGMTVSTKELVLHKPHLNYYIRLEDIVSITPFDASELRSYRFVSKQQSNREIVHALDGVPHYHLYAKEAIVHSRSGLHQHGAMRFIIPIHTDLLKAIGVYGQWDIAIEL